MPPLQELYSQLKAKEDVYSQLLAKGRLMLLNRDDSGSGSKTEQSVALLEQKWCLVSTKMEERKVVLAERCVHPCPMSRSDRSCSLLSWEEWSRPGLERRARGGGGVLVFFRKPLSWLCTLSLSFRWCCLSIKLLLFFLHSHQSWLNQTENESKIAF